MCIYVTDISIALAENLGKVISYTLANYKTIYLMCLVFVCHIYINRKTLVEIESVVFKIEIETIL